MLNSWQMIKSCFCEQAGSPDLADTLALDFEHNTYYEQNVVKTLDNREALNQFLAGVEKRAFRMADLATGNPDHAMDIVQDAMMSLVKNYSHKNEADWGPLFYRILQNGVRDWHRRQAVRNRVMVWFGRGADSGEEYDPIAAAPDPTGRAPEEEVSNSEAMAMLEVAVQDLPTRQREAFMLRTFEGLDVAGTAAAMGCSEGSVKTHYSRAIHSLRGTLGDFEL